MALRNIDTNFFKSPKVRGLKGALKTLYLFIICDCSASGIWIKDLEIANLFIDAKITEIEFLQLCEKVNCIDLGGGKYFFPDFIEHQYPKGLQENNPALKNVFFDLKKYNLLDENLKINTKGLQRGFADPIGGSLVSVIVNDNVIVNKIKKNEKMKIEKKEIEIPSKEEFLNFGLEFCKTNNISIQKYQIEAKYESWFESGWKDGNGKKIVNWKTKFKNTAAYMPKSKEISKPQYDYGQSGI